MISHYSNIATEDFYKVVLMSYLKKNEGKTEQDFLTSELKLQKSALENLNKVNYDNIKNAIIKDSRPNYINSNNEDAWIDSEIRKHKVNIKNRISHCKRIIFDFEIRLNRFPRNESKIIKESKVENNVKYKHIDIFRENGYKLFKHILEEYIAKKGVKGRYSDLSYFYRVLYEDGYIHAQIVPFTEWFNLKYQENIDKIKMIYQVENKDRIKHYSNALAWFRN